MKPIIFGVIAVFLYASQNVIIQRKLTTVSPLVNVAGFYVVVLTLAGLALLGVKSSGAALTLPQGTQWLWLGICAALLFAADCFYFSAYTGGAKLVVITMLAVLLPVFASLVNWATGGGIDLTWRHITAWVLATVAVVLVAK